MENGATLVRGGVYVNGGKVNVEGITRVIEALEGLMSALQVLPVAYPQELPGPIDLTRDSINRLAGAVQDHPVELSDKSLKQLADLIPRDTRGQTVTIGSRRTATEATLKEIRDRTAVHTLTARMLSKQPTENYRIWMDTANTSYVLITEAPAGTTDEATLVWRGVRLPVDANGAVVGEVKERTGFAWSNRGAGW